MAYAPKPGDPAYGSVTITPGSDWDWKGADVELFWPFSSIFIWVTACSADVSFGYDETGPYDAFTSGDSGITWLVAYRRYFFQTYRTGLSIGEVAVGGEVGLTDRSTYTPSHVTADTAIKGTMGRLHTVTINSCGTAGTLTLYDNTAESGTVLAAIAIPVTPTPFTLTYDVRFNTGLYAGFDATLAADVTISYI